MDKVYLERISRIRQNVAHLYRLIYSTPCFAQRLYYQDLLLMEVDQLVALTTQIQSLPLPGRQTHWGAGYGAGREPGCRGTSTQGLSQPNAGWRQQQREQVFTSEKLAQYDGSKGQPAYVAIDGIVYDVSLEPTWGGGTHFSLYAGQDLTGQFQGCHAGMEEILKQLPQVGILQAGEGD